MSLLKKLFDHEYKELKRFRNIANQIDALDEEYSKLTDTELQNKTEVNVFPSPVFISAIFP